jgi:Cu/Ag efflux protein CusF
MRFHTLAAWTFLALLVLGAAIQAEEFRGTITKIDPAGKGIVVEGRGRARGLALDFAVNSETRITAGKDPAKLEDLQAGDRVRLLYENQNGQRVALAIADQSLRLKPAAPAPAAAPAPGGPPAPAPVAGPNTVSGRLAHVGFTEREIVVVTPGSQGSKETESMLLVPLDVKISKDQKSVKFEDLKDGEQVTVRTEKRDGHLVAAEIQAGGAATAMTPMPPPENRRIEKIRQVLKIADWFLQQMEEQQKGSPKP